MSEARQTRLKRLAMRSMRRGIKEMDLILSHFAGNRLADMDAATLDLYEALLEENDHDIYQWITGQTPTPTGYLELVTAISAGAKGVVRP